MDQSHDNLKPNYKWDSTFHSMQNNIDDMRGNIRSANQYIVESKACIDKIDLKSVSANVSP